MKKFLVCALALLMLVFSCAALCEKNAEDAKDGWYELSLNGEVLTVRLLLNPGAEILLPLKENNLNP